MKEPDIGLTIQFTGTELKDNSLTISWEHESKTFSKTFTLVSDTVLSSSNLMWEQAPPIAFTKEKQAARQVDEAMLKRISGTWGPKDSNDWMLRVERQAGFDSDGVIRFIMVEVIDEKGKVNRIDRRVPFRLASSTGDTAVLHLLPAPPATVFSLYGSAMANVFLKDDLKIHFLQANIVEITSPDLNELVLRKR